MKKKTILISIIFILVSVYSAGSSIKFNIIEKNNEYGYIKIFKGTDSGIKKRIKGEIYDEKGGQIGNFIIISTDEFESIAKLIFLENEKKSNIKFISIKSLNLERIIYKLENSLSYLIIDKGIKDNIKKGMKGSLYSKGKFAGLFKVVSCEKNKSIIKATNLNIGYDYIDIDSGKTKDYLARVIESSGIVNLSYKNIIMIFIGILFIYLGVAKDYEPLLLVPIGFGIILGNIPLPLQIFNAISLYMIDPITHQYAFNTTSNSVMGIIYFGVRSGLFPPLIFLGIGAMTDFTALLSSPKSVLLGAAAQIGIFVTFLGALAMKFSPANAASIGIIGGADGPTAIFLSSRLSPSLVGPIAIAAYSYMAMVPIIQPPIMRLLTTKKERLIRMKPGRKVSKLEKIGFPISAFIITTLIAPGAIPLLGMLFFGNLLKESGVTTRLAKTAANALIDICTILLGLSVGASTTAQVFLNEKSILIFILGVVSFGIATAGGVLFAKFMNLFLKKDNKINPLIGAAGVSAVPDSARVAQMVGRQEDPNNYLLMHAMGPNVAGVIGSAIAAGIFLGIF
jgi:oxaloacetate decarboxylase beta subunit